ncbi:glycoside hydrolase family 43 protein [Aspergillus saccharolyticus JOP 1030-1]|uniref:Glycosyl hydrolase family 43 protein n=1 Tax=Aspergillus saccharolyticus JOP 1030-1 TaxID=1450539 RepID=A0A318ZN60_9EURO|nr:glycosyl hydrolase family 43 protein [Aspergillus saccharolyticus JOP 1030-1]PYH48956.1 glycosyl hydrolase family 43 protein [Aspergillus saccharolyticus JOP 1030-1]
MNGLWSRLRSPSKPSIRSAEAECGADQGINPLKSPDSASLSESSIRDAGPWTRGKILTLSILAFFALTLIVVAVTVPVLLVKRNRSHDDPSYHDAANRPVQVLSDFPDPGLLHVNNTWYTYGTNAAKNDSEVPHVPVATATVFNSWTRLEDHDAMPSLSSWETKINHYAPDVIQRDDGRFVLYYSGELKDWLYHHCVGVAVSNGTNPAGPFMPQSKPLACPRNQGGAIDPSPFRDVDGKLYVVYKADANSIGHGGDCNNGKKPVLAVPILLQELEADGVTPVGNPVQILQNDKSDGPLVEAPNILRTPQGIYYLFFSSHCFTSPKYNVKYAYATSLKGPYTRANRPLLKTGDFDLISPGGATVSRDGTKMVFHANCGKLRCLYAAAITIHANSTITPSSL